MVFRIASFIILFLSAVFAPWQITMGLGAVFAALFPHFWEMIFAGFIIGSIYGFSNGHSEFLFAFFSTSFIIAFFAEENIKKFIKGDNAFSHVITASAGGASFALLWLIFKIIISYV